MDNLGQTATNEKADAGPQQARIASDYGRGRRHGERSERLRHATADVRRGLHDLRTGLDVLRQLANSTVDFQGEEVPVDALDDRITVLHQQLVLLQTAFDGYDGALGLGARVSGLRGL